MTFNSSFQNPKFLKLNDLLKYIYFFAGVIEVIRPAPFAYLKIDDYRQLLSVLWAIFVSIYEYLYEYLLLR